MANSLWAGAFRKGLSTARPTVPDFPDDTFGFYYETDTGILYYGVSGESSWRSTGAALGSQGTPTAKTATFTATIAELLTGIVTVTSATAVALTLPTGALTDAGLSGGYLAVDQSFDWSVINLGSSSGAVTMTASSGHTYVGSATVAISTTARFRTRKTADDTFVTYRIS